MEQERQERTKAVQLEQVAAARLGANIQRAIIVASLILPLLFMVLLFRDTTVDEVVQSLINPTVSSLVWKISATAYLLSWAFGGHLDAAHQARAYRYAPKQGQIPRAGYGILVGLVLLAALLLNSSSLEAFAAALAGLLVLDAVGWVYLRHFLRPIIVESGRNCEFAADFIGLEEVRVVERAICGRWRASRLIAMGATVLVFAIVAFSDRMGLALTNLFGQTPLETKRAFAMLLFVGVFEGWIWIERLKTRAALSMLEEMRARYTISNKITIGAAR